MEEIYFNLNFDDFHPQTDKDGDFGGDLENGNFKYIKRLWEEFPGLTVTMFTVPNWTDAPYRRGSWYYHIRKNLGLQSVVLPLEDEPFRLDKHPEWCAEVKKMVEAGRLEIAVHGYKHYNPKSVIHGQEFDDISKEEAIKKIKAAEKIFESCGLPCAKGFRPPGWGVSPGLFEALRELKYDFIATQSSNSKTSEISEYEGLKNIPQNYSIKEGPEEALRQAELTGRVLAKGHMCYTYGKETIENGLDEKHFQNLRMALVELSKNFKVNYVSLSELVRMGR